MPPEEGPPVERRPADTPLKRAFVEALAARLRRGEGAALGGFGRLERVRRPARAGVHPVTGAAIPIPARWDLVFHPGPALLDALAHPPAEARARLIEALAAGDPIAPAALQAQIEALGDFRAAIGALLGDVVAGVAAGARVTLGGLGRFSTPRRRVGVSPCTARRPPRVRFHADRALRRAMNN